MLQLPKRRRCRAQMPRIQVGLKFPGSMQSAVPKQYETPGTSGTHVPEMSLNGGSAGAHFKAFERHPIHDVLKAVGKMRPPVDIYVR